MEIIHLEPLIENLTDTDIGSIMLTCKNFFIMIKQIIGLVKAKYCIAFYLSLTENNYEHINGNEKMFDKMLEIMDDKMDLFFPHSNVLYDDIGVIIQKYDNQQTRNTIILMEYYKRLPVYKQIEYKKNDTIFSCGNKYRIVELCFYGNYNFGRFCACSFGKNRNFVDYITIRVVLPDLPMNYKYKKFWSLNFFRGSKLTIDNSDICFLQFVQNKNIFPVIVNNVIYWTINLADIFTNRISTNRISSLYNNSGAHNLEDIQKECDSLFEQDFGTKSAGMHTMWNEYEYRSTIVVKLGDIEELVETNFSKKIDLSDLIIQDMSIFCRYSNNEVENVESESLLAQKVVKHLFEKIRPVQGKYRFKLSAPSNIAKKNISRICLIINDIVQPDYNFSQLQDGVYECPDLTSLTLPENADVSVMVEYQSLIFYLENKIYLYELYYVTDL